MITLTLPEPPSSNKYWRSVVVKGQPRVLLSAEARAYRAVVAGKWLQSKHKQAHGPIGIRLTWYRSRKSGDLSNRIKQLEDALNGLAWQDDKQIEYISAVRVDDSLRKGEMEIDIVPIGDSDTRGVARGRSRIHRTRSGALMTEIATDTTSAEHGVYEAIFEVGREALARGGVDASKYEWSCIATYLMLNMAHSANSQGLPSAFCERIDEAWTACLGVSVVMHAALAKAQ